MQTYFVPLAVDQNYNEINFHKQIAISLLNLDLEKKEKVVRASIIGWPLLIKKTEQGFLVLDQTLRVSSRILKYIYPPFNDVASEFSSMNDYTTFVSNLKKINLKRVSSNEITLIGLLNIEIDKLLKVAKNSVNANYQLFMLDSKLSDHDVKVIKDTLISLKAEAIFTITSLESLVKEVDDVRVRIKKGYASKLEATTKKYNELIENKKKEIDNEVQKANSEIYNETNSEISSRISRLTDITTRHIVVSLKYEGGIVGRDEFENSKNEFENLLNEFRQIKDSVAGKYLEKIKNLRKELDSLYSERNSEIENINKLMKDLDNVTNDFKNDANKVKENIENFIKYIESFYNTKLDMAEDSTLVIPFLIAKTNTGNTLVVQPQVYKGKTRGILGKVFKKSDLSEPLLNLQVFTEYLKTIDIIDNVKIHSIQINNALKEINDEGWRSLDSLEEIYA
ncbi:hypothetical protein SULI_02920 [Saccharolobus solfataricus]|nr:hypothetical protein [Saccharolobus solfataricus]AZF67480.1 hypothetical protein SULG_02920 [Saccharolobus solfataricus]AZF70100.1 hypothetical protein SULH_02920 [Saccharolobus solfataricus]AZF72720.1 hypothetical protein SULI_02920 [Saccharolobus solfataricus]AZF75342.1 hypothetical protein SULM_02920 [Saccharolobus solfataricus]AZF77951.1 hypothetical protein SULN_02920 [Saccharolobus solfataricus]